MRTAWLTGTLLSGGTLLPVLAAATVEIAAGTVAPHDQHVMQELVAAFDRAEVAVQRADVENLMLFYAPSYNYHGLKRPDVKRVWTEVFEHYVQLSSKHLFTGLKVLKSRSIQKAFVTCTGGLYGTEKESGKPITVDSWVHEVHYLVNEGHGWKFLGNVGGTAPQAPPASAPHHPLF